MFDFQSVYQAYIACRRGKRASHNTQRYEVRLLDHLVSTSEALQSRRWSPARSVSFVCTRPKAREIHAADFADRVVHHILVPKLEAIYEPLFRATCKSRERRFTSPFRRNFKLEFHRMAPPYTSFQLKIALEVGLQLIHSDFCKWLFIHDSYSNRKNKGTHAAVDRLQGFMRKVSCNGKRKAFFLQLDIRNFFNRIHRNILLDLLHTRLNKALVSDKISGDEHTEIYWLCSTLLKNNAADHAFQRGCSPSFDAVPAYKRLSHAPDDCGLAIGNLTSQFFANVYLNELDQFIKHDLKCCYYLRYVDDFVLLHESEAQLLQWRKDIQAFLSDVLKLELKALSKPVPVSKGCDFLGYVTRPHYKLVRRRVLHHCMEKLSDLQHVMVRKQTGGLSIYLKAEYRDALQATLASYWGHYLHASSFKLETSVLAFFSWLNCLFEIRAVDKNKRKLLPRWQPVCVSSFQGQWHWFQNQFIGFVQMIQVGHGFVCVDSDRMFFPEYVQEKMKKNKALSWVEDIYIAPLSMLKGVRSYLRQSGIAHIFVAEEGYLPQGTLSAASGIHLVRGGLKRRVLRLLWQPNPCLSPLK